MRANKNNLVKDMDSTYLSREELEGLIFGLTHTDILRLRKIANTYTGGHSLEADDLINEAVDRILSGSRKSCPADVSAVTFIANAMRSIASGERDKNKVRLAYAEKEEAVQNTEQLSPEEKIVEADRLKELEAIFEDDEDILLLIYHLQDDSTPSEIQIAEGWSKTQYDTVRRRLRRKLNAHMEEELV